MWVTLNDKKAVAPLDPKTNKLGALIPLDVEPFGPALNGNTLWVISLNQSTILRIDLQSQKVVAKLTDVNAPVAIATTDLAIWVVSDSKETLTRIDPRTNKVVATIPLGITNSGPIGSRTVIADDNGVWVMQLIGKVVRIDPQTNQIAATITLNDSVEVAESTPYGAVSGIVSAPQGIWISSAALKVLGLIDPKTNKLIGSMPLASSGSDMTYGNGSLWIVSPTRQGNVVLKVDPKS